jgi:hypothetical protein
MQIGIVGLPYSGKSTLFQAVARMRLDPATLGRAETHQGVVKVPDIRLDRLAEIFSPRKTIHATIEFVDVAGLKKGESGSTQFTTNFLASVKNNDALVQVVRLFANDSVPHPDGNVDVLRDVAVFETEFILSDLAIIESRLERIAKQLQKSPDETVKREQPLLQRCHQILEQERPLREAPFGKEELQLLKTYQLLTLKPMLIAINCDESQRELAKEVVGKVAAARAGTNTKAMFFFGRIDLEISELPPGEAKSFLAEYGIAESALDTLIREAYALLGLRSFFTVGEDECRAWTIRAGMTAQESAGVIHSDFYARFIRAEVVHYDDFLNHGNSMAKAKEAGVWRLEGKEYSVRDGDIISVRHS